MRVGDPNRLYLNVAGPNGTRSFERAANDAGAGDTGAATGAIAADIDNDGDRDLYVINFDQPNALYRNLLTETGSLAFEYDLSPTFGNRTGGAMGVEAGDIDNDGDLDIYMTDWSDLDQSLSDGRNDLWVNQLADSGTLSFEHTDDALPGVFSWGTLWTDVNNDGRLDVHVAAQGPASDRLYEQTASGFVETGVSSGIAQTGDGRGDPGADLDLDGNGALGSGESQRREVKSGSGNAASTSALIVHSGLNVAPTAVLDVAWPSGRNTLASVAANQRLRLSEADHTGPVDMLDNGNFAAGLDGWRTQVAGTSQAVWSVEGGAPNGASALRADVAVDDGTGWHVQLYQGERPVAVDQPYRVSFDARASAPGSLTVMSGEDHEPWGDLGLSDSVALGTAWQRYERVYTASGSDADGAVDFQDLATMKRFFFGSPGPSAAGACAVAR
ncbi:MAG: FG-GAP-like repeat-containing protein [Pseudomonadota bacterium]